MADTVQLRRLSDGWISPPMPAAEATKTLDGYPGEYERHDPEAWRQAFASKPAPRRANPPADKAGDQADN